MMEASSTSETSVNFYQTTRRNNPEDSHLYTRRRENLKAHGNESSGSGKEDKSLYKLYDYQFLKKVSASWS
jgi:hypothetical protein